MRAEPVGDVAVVGCTGAVGRELLCILEQRGLPIGRIRALASERSAGKGLRYAGSSLQVESLARASWSGVRVAVFCTDTATSLRYVPVALRAGARVVDNSSAFRRRAEVPLVIPECNGELLRSAPRLVANPNCSTVLLLCALQPLRQARCIERVVVSTYQAVSGAGLDAIEELRAQNASVARGERPVASIFREPCAGNVFTHESEIDAATGCNVEERKMSEEARRVWEAPRLDLFATCVRVPVERAHSQAIVVELAQPIELEELRGLYAAAPYLEVVDDWTAGRFPTPLAASGGDRVQVGRLRLVPGSQGRRVALWVCGDQLRKGAALNAWQIVEHHHARDGADRLRS